jgi:hypothetical protein
LRPSPGGEREGPDGEAVGRVRGDIAKSETLITSLANLAGAAKLAP